VFVVEVDVLEGNELGNGRCCWAVAEPFKEALVTDENVFVPLLFL